MGQGRASKKEAGTGLFQHQAGTVPGRAVLSDHASWPYDDEPATIVKMEEYIRDNGYITDITDQRRHHEIYLGDPRKTKPENLKTVIRHPVRKN